MARSPPGLDFCILGPLEVFDDGRAVPLGRVKQRALLGLLLLHPNETLSTDRLIDELWGERPPASAAKAVHARVSRLRRALAGDNGSASADLVVTRERGYELRLDPERLDSHRFERLVAEGRSELAAGRRERAVSAFERALSLWRGAPLADLADEPFAQSEIARLEDLRVMALELLIEAKLALGRHADVVGQLETLIAEHPYREGLRAQLMLALYRCDRQADALQAYQDARRTLIEELGIEPGERLRELERAILAQDPALAVPAEETAELPPELGAGTLLAGRDAELDWLREHWRRARGGAGRLVLVTGETRDGQDAAGGGARRRGASRSRRSAATSPARARRMPHAQRWRARATPAPDVACARRRRPRRRGAARRAARARRRTGRRCPCSCWRRPRIQRSRRHRARARCSSSARSRRTRCTPWRGFTRGRWMTWRSRSSGSLRRAVASRGACTGPPASGRDARRRGAWASRPNGRRANARACARPRTTLASDVARAAGGAGTRRARGRRARRSSPARSRGSRRLTSRTPSCSSAASGWWPRWWRAWRARR